MVGISVLYHITDAYENQITASEHPFCSYKDKIRILESQVNSVNSVIAVITCKYVYAISLVLKKNPTINAIN